MSAIIDIPEVGEYTEHNLSAEQSQAHATHPRFWQTVGAYVRRQRAHRRHETPASCQRVLHPMEMPLERLAREHPMLFLQINTGL